MKEQADERERERKKKKERKAGEHGGGESWPADERPRGAQGSGTKDGARGCRVMFTNVQRTALSVKWRFEPGEIGPRLARTLESYTAPLHGELRFIVLACVTICAFDRWRTVRPFSPPA